MASMTNPSSVTTQSVNLSDPALWDAGRPAVFEALATLRRDEPVSRQVAPTTWAPPQYPPEPYWAVTRYADIKEISRDNLNFSNSRGVGFAMSGVPSEVVALEGFLATDPPLHDLARQVVARTFTPRILKKMDEFIIDQTRIAIAAVQEQGSCDFQMDLAAPVPRGVICDMLGVPREDLPWIAEQTEFLTSGPEEFVGVLIDNANRLMDYGTELSRKRRKDPREDITSLLASASVDGRPLTDEQVGGLFNMIITAATETTTQTMAHAMLGLTQFPDERRRWQADYEGVAGMAVEEILRWGTVLPTMRRYVTNDVEAAGHQFSAGDHVELFYLSANYDETVFRDPHRLDLSRFPNDHQAFGGGGIHFCLGNALARKELRLFFKELFEFLPDLQIVPEGVTGGSSPVTQGFEMEPCVFTPTSAARSLT